MRTRVLAPVTALLLTAGCLPLQLLDPSSADPGTQLVPSSPFGAAGTLAKSPPQTASYAKANEALAKRVTAVGYRVLQANPEIGMKPHFATYGTPRLELFHTGNYLVHITEGLVQRCQGDGQLAALLCHELGEMVAEREVLASPRMRHADEKPPMDVLIGTGVQRNDFEQVRLTELARFEQKRKQEVKKPLPLPDPKKLAALYLEKAGYSPADLDAIQPLLTEAEKTFVLEKQIRQAPVNSNWTAAPPGQ